MVLSVIIPSYNEGKNLTAILERLLQVELPYGMDREIIIVDDGSTDDTALLAEAFIVERPKERVRLIRHESNQGKGMAIRTAIEHVEGDVVVIQDSDTELDPADFVPMLREMIGNDLQVVYGSRFLSRENKILYRSFYYGTRVLSWLVNVLYAQHITDEATCYKMFRTPLLRSISLKCRGFEFCPEVTAKVARRGIKIREVPVHYYPRTKEEGKKIRAIDGVKAMYYLFKYRVVK